jgi:hypothetical protein
MQAPQQRPARTISTRLREERNLGDLDLLTADIRDRGLRHPVSVARDGRLILGARRLAACVAAGIDPIDCWPLTRIADAVAVIAWENEDDLDTGDVKYHVPATLAALAAQDMAVRELAWWPRGIPAANPGARDHRAELSGALCGPGEAGLVSAGQYVQLHSIAAAAAGWQAGPGGAGRVAVPPAARRTARKALEMLDHRDPRLINALYSRWRDEMPLAHPEMKPLMPADVGPFAAVITGFTSAIRATGLPDQDMTATQIDVIDDALSDLLRAVSAYRRTLRQAR